LLAARLAAVRITDSEIDGLRRLLDEAKENIADNDILNRVNMLFHKRIAAASGNTVIPEVLGVLSALFSNAQRVILSIYGSNTRDHSEHLAILDALIRRDPELAASRMEAHLDDVLDAIRQWNPEEGLPGAT
jgi:GntR family transcriptional repressor for pyruvate dehydrogenase complex